MEHYVHNLFQNKKWILLFLFLELIIPLSGKEKILPYSEIDPILRETWEKTYPVNYLRIVKKDVIGKGIMEIREKNRFIYLYTFIIYFPKYRLEGEKLVADEEGGKEILVKLYFRPGEKESPYQIDLGEFFEQYNLGSVRWIK